MTEDPVPPRWPCPSGGHHLHPGLSCAEYEQWRVRILAAIRKP